MKRCLIPVVAALAALCGAPAAIAGELLDVRPVQSAYHSSLSEQTALVLAGGDGDPLAPATAAEALAVNLSRTLQIIRQVQWGCRSYCYGDRMIQKAWQDAVTRQLAGAQAIANGGIASAAALNLSETIQTIEQIQNGCRLFCYGLSMHQAAWQRASTDEWAEAVAGGGEGGAAALAANISLTRQVILQIQRACKRECYGITLTQEAWQVAATGQHSRARAEGEQAANDGSEALSALGEAGAALVPATAVAENLSETLQIIEQIQSDCRRFCYEGVALGDAEWFERTGLAAVYIDPFEEEALLAEDGEEEDAAPSTEGDESDGPEVADLPGVADVAEGEAPVMAGGEGPEGEAAVTEGAEGAVSEAPVTDAAADAAAEELDEAASEDADVLQVLLGAEALNEAQTEQALEQRQQ